jgi:hypothetical protein
LAKPSFAGAMTQAEPTPNSGLFLSNKIGYFHGLCKIGGSSPIKINSMEDQRGRFSDICYAITLKDKFDGANPDINDFKAGIVTVLERSDQEDVEKLYDIFVKGMEKRNKKEVKVSDFPSNLKELVKFMHKRNITVYAMDLGLKAKNSALFDAYAEEGKDQVSETHLPHLN